MSLGATAGHALRTVGGDTLDVAVVAIAAALGVATLIALLIVVVLDRPTRAQGHRSRDPEPAWWPEFERDFARYVAGLHR